MKSLQQTGREGLSAWPCSIIAFTGCRNSCKQADLDDPLFYGLDHFELFLSAQHIMVQLKACRQTPCKKEVQAITQHRA
jgi:hypothetical protein